MQLMGEFMQETYILSISKEVEVKWRWSTHNRALTPGGVSLLLVYILYVVNIDFLGTEYTRRVIWKFISLIVF